MNTSFLSMTGVRACDVVGCTAFPAGSYLDASDSRHIEFQLCADHLASFQGGKTPSIVAARIDLAMMHERPALSFGPS